MVIFPVVAGVELAVVNDTVTVLFVAPARMSESAIKKETPVTAPPMVPVVCPGADTAFPGADTLMPVVLAAVAAPRVIPTRTSVWAPLGVWPVFTTIVRDVAPGAAVSA